MNQLIKRLSLILAAILLFIALSFPAAQAVKKRYDKITGFTEYRTPRLVAKCNLFTGNSILYKLVALHSESKDATKVFLVFQAYQRMPLFESETPLYLLIDDEERKELVPISSKTNEAGGIGTYWGFGISTYRREIVQKSVYEIDRDLLNKIRSAKRLDVRVEDAIFNIHGWSLDKMQEVAEVVVKNYPDFERKMTSEAK